MKLAAYYIHSEPTSANKVALELVKGLAERGVPVVETTNNGLNITTPHVYITFVTDLHMMRGRHFDVIFGPVPENFKYTCLKDPSLRTFKGTLLNYVLSAEGLM